MVFSPTFLKFVNFKVHQLKGDFCHIISTLFDCLAWCQIPSFFPISKYYNNPLGDPKMTKAKNEIGFLILKSNTQYAHIVSDRSVIIFCQSHPITTCYGGVVWDKKKRIFSPLSSEQYADVQMCNRSKICRICKLCKTNPSKLKLPNLVSYDLPNQTKTFQNKLHQSLLVKLMLKLEWFALYWFWIGFLNWMLMHMFENMQSQSC